MDNFYKNTKVVIELTNYDEVNKFLKLGWCLEGSYTTGYDSVPPMVYDQTKHYCLLWNKDTEPKYPEKSKTGEYL